LTDEMIQPNGWLLAASAQVPTDCHVMGNYQGVTIRAITKSLPTDRPIASSGREFTQTAPTDSRFEFGGWSAQHRKGEQKI
jgi:hypothetical protein